MYITHVDNHNALWGSGVYYGGAFGGKYTEYKPLRRVGVSIVVCDSNGDLLHGSNFNLPGDVQTAPRAEFSAVLTVAQRAEVGVNITVYCDNQSVVKQYNNTIVSITYFD